MPTALQDLDGLGGLLCVAVLDGVVLDVTVTVDFRKRRRQSGQGIAGRFGVALTIFASICHLRGACGSLGS